MNLETVAKVMPIVDIFKLEVRSGGTRTAVFMDLALVAARRAFVDHRAQSENGGKRGRAEEARSRGAPQNKALQTDPSAVSMALVLHGGLPSGSIQHVGRGPLSLVVLRIPVVSEVVGNDRSSTI